MKQIIILFLFSPCWSIAQGPFNKTFNSTDTLTRVEKLFETEDAYYAMCYADYVGTAHFGFQIQKHDRSSGEVLSKSYFGIDGAFMSITGQSPIYHKDDKLIFHCDSPNMYEFEYDLYNNEIAIRDSFINPAPEIAGFFLYDVRFFGDTTVYVVTQPYDNEDEYQPALLIRYPDNTKQVKTYELSDSLSGFNSIRKISPDRYLVTGSKVMGLFFYNTTVSVNILDENFDIIHQFSSEVADHYFSISDIYMPDDTTAFLLTKKFKWDDYGGEVGFEHNVLRYNLNTDEIEWAFGKSEYPIALGTNKGSIVPSHEPDHLLYCTTEGRYSESGDSLEIIGKVFKINYEGDLIWERSYSHYNQYGSQNVFKTMIPTSDRRYLVGGTVRYGGVNSWLVKIDEDGNVLEDNVSSLENESVEAFKEYKIYPNPASDILEIEFNFTRQSVFSINIYTLHGSLLLSKDVEKSTRGVKMDISSLPEGQFFYQINEGSKILASGPLLKI
jgi:hypothetical protein